MVFSHLSVSQPHTQVGVGTVVISGSLGGVMVSVVVYTDLSGTAHTLIQIGVCAVMISGSIYLVASVVVCSDLWVGMGIVLILGSLGGSVVVCSDVWVDMGTVNAYYSSLECS